MKNRLWTLVAVLALVAIWGKEYSKPVFAQVRAALTRDIDNPARNAVQFQLWGGTSGGAHFYTVPSGKTLIIEDVSFMTLDSGAETFGIITTVKGATLLHWFAPGGFSVSGSSTGGSWFGGRTTRIYADQLTEVEILENGHSANSEFVFSGYLLDANP